MWNPSFPRLAEQQLAAARAEASRARLIGQLPPPITGRHPLREAVGQLLIRIGAKLVMTSTPTTPTTPSAAR